MEEKDLRKWLGVDVLMVTRKCRLSWSGHFESRVDETWVKKIRKLDIQGGTRAKGEISLAVESGRE